MIKVADGRCGQNLYSKVEMCSMQETALDVEGESIVRCLYGDEIKEQEYGRRHGVEEAFIEK